MMGLSVWELLILLLIVALLFGTGKLRNIGGDLGSAIKSFRNAMKSGDGENSGGDENTPPKGTTLEGKTESPAKTPPDNR